MCQFSIRKMQKAGSWYGVETHKCLFPEWCLWSQLFPFQQTGRQCSGQLFLVDSSLSPLRAGCGPYLPFFMFVPLCLSGVWSWPTHSTLMGTVCQSVPVTTSSDSTAGSLLCVSPSNSFSPVNKAVSPVRWCS